MASRFLGTGMAVAMLAGSGLALPNSSGAAETPRYTNFGITYEETDIKLGVDPSDSDTFNNGDFYLWNIQAGLAITDWAHVAGEYFTGNCNSCGTDAFDPITNEPTNTSDLDFEGYRIGVGVNPALSFIGWDQVQAVVRVSYADVKLDGPYPGTGTINSDGYTVDTYLRGQINEAADIYAGTEYQNLDDVENVDVVIGMNYEVWKGVALTASGNIFNNPSGFQIGLRWFFGEQLMGGDALLKN